MIDIISYTKNKKETINDNSEEEQIKQIIKEINKDYKKNLFFEYKSPQKIRKINHKTKRKKIKEKVKMKKIQSRNRRRKKTEKKIKK